MRFFDTHCHFDFAPFIDDIENQVVVARRHRVERMIIPSVGVSNWQLVTDLAQRFPSVYYALGFHPYFLAPDSPQYIAQLENRLAHRGQKCVAVGECGLDGMLPVDSALQEQLFVQQLDLATNSQLPLILHSRKTHNRLLQLIKQKRFAFGGVLHGFSGSYQQAMQFIELGFYIGVGGVITYPRANKTRRAVAQLPLDKLVLETDAPDMPLNGFQGKANHPKMIGQIVSCLAELKALPRQTIAETVWRNSNSAFGICE